MTYEDFQQQHKGHIGRHKSVEMTKVDDGINHIFQCENGEKFRIQINKERPIPTENAELILDKFYPYASSGKPFHLMMERLS